MRKRCPVVSDASPFSRILALLQMSAAIMVVEPAHALAQGAFSVSSADLAAGGIVAQAQVFDLGECKGGNRSPQLSWRDAPAGTRGFAVTMFDLDAPGHGWWNWAVVGIPADVRQLPSNASASGFLKGLGAVEARNDFDTDGYGGPCPRPGKPHRYAITVYALRTNDLRLATGLPALIFDHEIGVATLGSTQFVVTYGR